MHEWRNQPVSELLRQLGQLRGKIADLENELQRRFGSQEHVAERAVEQSRLMRLLMEKSSEGLVVVDQDTRTIMYVNMAACALFGRDEQALVGEPFSFGMFGDSLADIDLYREEDVLKSEMRSLPVQWEGRKAWLVHVHDLTKRTVLGLHELALKYRKELLEAQREKHKIVAFIHSLPEVVFRLDSRKKFVFVNNAVKKYGYSPEELLGASLFSVVHPEDRGWLRSYLKYNLAGCMELRVLHKAHNTSGVQSPARKKEKPYSVFIVDAEAIHDGADAEETRIFGVRGIGRDITALKRAQSEVASAEDRLRFFYDAVPGYVHSVDKDFRILDVSESFLKALGVKETSRLRGRHCYQVYHGRENPCPECLVREVFATGTAQTRYSTRFDPRFDWIYSKSQAVPLFNAVGELTGALEIILDVSDERCDEQCLRQTRKQAMILMRFAKRLLSRHTFEEVALLTLETAGYLTDSTSGIFGFKNPDTQKFTSYVCTPLKKGVCDCADNRWGREAVKGLYSVLERAGESIMSNAPAKDNRFKGARPGRIFVDRLAVAPIFASRHKIFGCVGLCNAPRNYVRDDLELLERIADICGAAMKRVMYEQTLATSISPTVPAGQGRGQCAESMLHEAHARYDGISE